MNFIFIVGCPHSGTSIMHRLIGQHPQVHWISWESFLFTKGVDSRVEQISKWQSEAVQAGKTFVAEKTTWHLFHINEFAALAPGAKFVCMLRDGRDVVASLMNRGRTARIDGTLDGCIDLWKKSCEVLETVKTRKDVCVRRLEDLCTNPREELRSTLQFLGLSHSDSELEYILSYSDRPLPVYTDAYHKPESAKDGHDHGQLRNYQINSPIFRSTSRYANDLAKSEVDRLNSDLKFLLQKYNYI